MGKSLAKELQVLSRISNIQSYLLPTCFLHVHQPVISNPVKTLIGDRVLDKQNEIQLLHSLYNLHMGGEGHLK